MKEISQFVIAQQRVLVEKHTDIRIRMNIDIT